MCRDPGAGRVHLFTCQHISQVAVPREHTGSRDLVRSEDGALVPEFIRLIRELCVDQSLGAPISTSRVTIGCYFLIDLSYPDVVLPALELLKELRTAGPFLDGTGIALSGRTAASGSADPKKWFDVLQAFLEGLQECVPEEKQASEERRATAERALLQRLYILDGQDTNGAWLQTPQEMHRQAAEFTVHHGASPYRHHLRRGERKQLRDILGSGSTGGAVGIIGGDHINVVGVDGVVRSSSLSP